MSINNAQKHIIQSTFEQVTDPDRLATRFYERLFQVDPSTRSLFQGDMTEQRKKLMQTLSVVVSSLYDLESITPAIQALGKRHINYGVTVAHWTSVGTALIWSLEDLFGDAFTDAVRDAWLSAYRFIEETAIAAAYDGVEENA